MARGHPVLIIVFDVKEANRRYVGETRIGGELECESRGRISFTNSPDLDDQGRVDCERDKASTSVRDLSTAIKLINARSRLIIS